MKKAPPRHTRIPAPASGKRKTLLPLFAVGGSLAAVQVNALELGDAVVQSRLGQPLRASIALALAPNERLSESCVSLRQGVSPSGLPGVGRATITIADGALLLSGSQPIREPLVSANIVIRCPSAANLSREYMMFIDPPGMENSAPAVAQTAAVASTETPEPSTESAAPAATAEPVAIRPATAQQVPKSARRSSARAVVASPIGQATRYRVQPGDSLSEITQRIENRKMRLWDAVEVIFDANPEAFIDNDPNKLKAGSWLTIPSFDGSRPVVAAAFEPLPAAPDASLRPQVADVTDAPPVAESAAKEASTDAVVLPSTDSSDAIVAEQAAADSTGDVEPVADEGVGAVETGVAVSTGGEIVIIPDVDLDGPQTSSTSPNVTTATASLPKATAEKSMSSWLLWLGGAGIAVILALLLFGRSLRERFAPASMEQETELPIRSAWQLPESEGIEVDERVDWGLDDATVETEALDADLVMGTGLEETTDSTLGAEIGFPVPTEVDIELPFQGETSVDLLEADAVESGEYEPIDESDIVTVEQPALETGDEPGALADIDDDEELDTHSIEVATIEETALLPDSPVDPSIAFEMLEQDYEDELSATMALNVELTQAAAELASVAGPDSDDSDDVCYDEDATAAMSLASVTEMEFDDTVDGNAANDELELGLDEATIEMPSPDAEKTRMMARKTRVSGSKKAG